MASKLFKTFGTSKDAEKGGVWVNYDDVKFLVARAGGSNIAYADVLKGKIRPFRYQIEHGSLSKADDDRITAETYAETIIKDVQTLQDDGSWKQGVPTDAGNDVPYTTGAVIQLLMELPDLFRDLRACANDSAKFLKEAEAADVKNS